MKKRFKNASIAIAGLLCSVLVLFYLHAQVKGGQIALTVAEQQWIAQHRTSIRYAPIPDAPPFDFVENGHRKGITPDYIRLVEKKLGMEFVVVQYRNQTGIMDDLKRGEIDLVGSLQATPERRKYLNFTKPYYSIDNVILMLKERSGTYSLDDLQGFSIAIVNGSATYAHVGKLFPDYALMPVENAESGFRKVAQGDADAMIIDRGVASYYVSQRGFSDLRVAGYVDYTWDLRLASTRTHPELRTILDKALDSISDYQRFSINRNWITLDERASIETTTLILVIAGLLLLTLLSVGAIMVWNRVLKKQVRHRTHELGHARKSQQQATRALDESEERFRVLVESSSDIIWEMDKLGNYTYISPRVHDILGYAPERLVGQSAFSLMVPADTTKNLQGLRKAKATAVIDCEINTHTHKNGRKIILEMSGRAFADNTGQLAGFRGVSRDITERVESDAALKASEERFRNLVETTSDWIWEVDANGIFTYVSPQVGNLLGYTPQELIGKHFTEPMPRPEADAMGALFSEVVEQGAPIHSKVNINRHKTGRTVVFETSAVPFYDKAWNIMGYRGIDRDITARMTIEKQLDFERNLFRSFMDHAPDLIYFKDRDGHFIEVNNAKAIEVDLTPDEVVGKTDFDFLPKEQAQKRLDDDFEVMRSENPMQKEEFSTTSKGDRWYFTTKVPRYDENGGIVGTFGTSWDITARKKSGEELRRLRAQLSNIIDSMPSTLVGVDAESRVMQWNREAEHMTGTPAKQALGQQLREVFPDLGGEMARVLEAIENKELQHDEHIPCVIRGEQRFADVTVYPLTSNGDDGAVIRVDDVTNRVRIEEMMIQTEKMMSVGGLAAGMAHEINNPLAGILQTLQVMRNRITHSTDRNVTAAEEAGTSLEAIQTYMHDRGLLQMMDSVSEAGERAAKIVDNMLSFSRKDGVHFAPNNLADLLERSIELASNDYNLKKCFDFRHIRIEREYDDALKPIPCEASQIQQVILNLLTNSAQAIAEHPDHSEEPRITLRLEREADMALIEVEDNGPGMDIETRKRAFEPFFTTKEVGRGTGLGLSVSYFIITENHGGTMGILSEPGKGTCFSIRIPLKRQQPMRGLRL